jgi:hypothetical protein
MGLCLGGCVAQAILLVDTVNCCGSSSGMVQSCCCDPGLEEGVEVVTVKLTWCGFVTNLSEHLCRLRVVD